MCSSLTLSLTGLADGQRLTLWKTLVKSLKWTLASCLTCLPTRSLWVEYQQRGFTGIFWQDDRGSVTLCFTMKWLDTKKSEGEISEGPERKEVLFSHLGNSLSPSFEYDNKWEQRKWKEDPLFRHRQIYLEYLDDGKMRRTVEKPNWNIWRQKKWEAKPKNL